MTLFPRRSISNKLTLLMVAASSVALLVSGLAFIANDVQLIRSSRESQLASIAQVLASNSSAAISFRQTASCKEFLQSLEHQPAIVYACMLDENQEIIATYDRGTVPHHRPPPDRADGVQFTSDGFIDVTWPVQDGNERVGSFYMRATLSDLNAQLVRFWQVAALVMLVSLLLATLLAVSLQRVISAPILALAQAAQRVSDEGDYSIRVQTDAPDEIGMLYQQFNQMLGRIHKADNALRAAHADLRYANDQLEERVQQRTQQLRREMAEHERLNQQITRNETRMRAIVENASDAIITFDENRCVESFNSAAEEIFGCLAEEALGRHVTTLVSHAEGAVADLIDRTAVPASSKRCEALGCKRDGTNFPIELTMSNVSLGDRNLAIAFIRDLTLRKQAEQQLAELHDELLETSRKAGMADVANSVLHNVGNVLNSVNVSAALVVERLRGLRIGSLASVVGLLRSQEADLPGLMRDERGQRLPGYLDKLAQHLEGERTGMVDELVSLVKNIDHIKDIVRSQQSYAGVSGVIELCHLDRLMDDALQFARSSFERHGIQVAREYETLPPINVEKAKLLQILVNLIKNAKESMVAHDPPEKLMTLRVRAVGDRVRMEVADTGHGIAKTQLTAIFSHGFTTKKHGHGFGLHSSANAAKAMNGSLLAHSDGPGLGATFVVELPLPA